MTTIADLNASTTGVTATTPTKSAATAAQAASSLDKDAFLKLMVAQLKYQSPDSPVDTNQFMAQTAQMTQVESLQAIQKSQETLLAADKNLLGTSMIGQSITATNVLGGADIVGTVTGIKLGTDGPVLKIGDTEVALSAVKEINKASTTAK